MRPVRLGQAAMPPIVSLMLKYMFEDRVTGCSISTKTTEVEIFLGNEKVRAAQTAGKHVRRRNKKCEISRTYLPINLHF